MEDEAMRSYRSWHDEYDAPQSNLAARLRVVRRLISERLDATAGSIRVLSLCAGDGRDLLGVLEDRPKDVSRVSGRLVELDPVLAQAARSRAIALGARDLDVVTGDAGLPVNSAPALPADLVLLVGIFGNVSPADADALVKVAPTFCAPGAWLIWSRGGRDAAAIHRLSDGFGNVGFAGHRFYSESRHPYGVGVVTWLRDRKEPLPQSRMFEFLR